MCNLYFSDFIHLKHFGAVGGEIEHCYSSEKHAYKPEMIPEVRNMKIIYIYINGIYIFQSTSIIVQNVLEKIPLARFSKYCITIESNS